MKVHWELKRIELYSIIVENLIKNVQYALYIIPLADWLAGNISYQFRAISIYRNKEFKFLSVQDWIS